MAKKKEVVEEVVVPAPAPVAKTEKEELYELYAKLKALGVNSIGDLEVKISRL